MNECESVYAGASLWNFHWKYQTAFQSVGGENTSSHRHYQSSWSPLALSLPPESPSPTVGNTMSQRMAHWHEWHGWPHTESEIHLGHKLDFLSRFCECMFLKSLSHRSNKLSETIICNSKTDLLFGKKHIYIETATETDTVYNQSLRELVKGTKL